MKQNMLILNVIIIRVAALSNSFVERGFHGSFYVGYSCTVYLRFRSYLTSGVRAAEDNHKLYLNGFQNLYAENEG